MPARGKKKTRSQVKELLLLLLLKSKEPIGRYKLKEMLDMSEHEGIVRSMLNELHEQGYVSSYKRGSYLTTEGKRVLENRLQHYNIITIKDVMIPFLMSGVNAIGIHIKDRANLVHSGIEQRDASIRSGAKGATVVIMRKGVVSIPNVYDDLEAEHPETVHQITHLFNIQQNDVLIVVSATNRWKAYEGALEAAMTLQ